MRKLMEEYAMKKTTFRVLSLFFFLLVCTAQTLLLYNPIIISKPSPGSSPSLLPRTQILYNLQPYRPYMSNPEILDNYNPTSRKSNLLLLEELNAIPQYPDTPDFQDLKLELNYIIENHSFLFSQQLKTGRNLFTGKKKTGTFSYYYFGEQDPQVNASIEELHNDVYGTLKKKIKDDFLLSWIVNTPKEQHSYPRIITAEELNKQDDNPYSFFFDSLALNNIQKEKNTGAFFVTLHKDSKMKIFEITVSDKLVKLYDRENSPFSKVSSFITSEVSRLQEREEKRETITLTNILLQKNGSYKGVKADLRKSMEKLHGILHSFLKREGIKAFLEWNILGYSSSFMPVEKVDSSSQNEDGNHFKITIGESLLTDFANSSKSQKDSDIVEIEKSTEFLKISNDIIFRTYFRKNYDTNDYVTSRYISLKDGGSSLIIKDNNDEITLIDSGYTKKDAARIIKTLEDMQIPKDKLQFKIFITHPDADHIKGLLHMLKRGYVFKEIILPVPKNSASRERTEKFRKKLQQISQEYIEYTNSNNNYIKFVSGENHYFESIHERTVFQPESFDIKQCTAVGGMRLNFITFKNPGTVNNNSIMVRLEHKGCSQLNLGDIDTKVMKAFVEEYKKIATEEKIKKILANQLSISVFTPESNIMQWPHHYWFPKNQEDITVVEDFLLLINPQVLVITKPMKSVEGRQNEEGIKEFITAFNEKYRMNIRIKWLKNTGMNFLSLEGLAIPQQLGNLS